MVSDQKPLGSNPCWWKSGGHVSRTRQHSRRSAAQSALRNRSSIHLRRDDNERPESGPSIGARMARFVGVSGQAAFGCKDRIADLTADILERLAALHGCRPDGARLKFRTPIKANHVFGPAGVRNLTCDHDVTLCEERGSQIEEGVSRPRANPESGMIWKREARHILGPGFRRRSYGGHGTVHFVGLRLIAIETATVGLTLRQIANNTDCPPVQ